MYKNCDSVSSFNACLNKFIFIWSKMHWESNDRVLNSRPRSHGFKSDGVSALCPWARYINPSLVLVQPRKACPYITEKLWM